MVNEKPIYREELPKKGGLAHYADLRGGLAKKKGVVFFRRVDTPMYIM